MLLSDFLGGWCRGRLGLRLVLLGELLVDVLDDALHLLLSLGVHPDLCLLDIVQALLKWRVIPVSFRHILVIIVTIGVFLPKITVQGVLDLSVRLLVARTPLGCHLMKIDSLHRLLMLLPLASLRNTVLEQSTTAFLIVILLNVAAISQPAIARYIRWKSWCVWELL